MIVSRWRATVLPNEAQIRMIFESEGLNPTTETYSPGDAVKEHRHPFDEVRIIISGQIQYNVAGNRLLLRTGDRIEIPSNTKHETRVDGAEPCVSLYARKPPG